jgi:hypothetical protein
VTLPRNLALNITNWYASGCPEPLFIAETPWRVLNDSQLAEPACLGPSQTLTSTSTSSSTPTSRTPTPTPTILSSPSSFTSTNSLSSLSSTLSTISLPSLNASSLAISFPLPNCPCSQVDASNGLQVALSSLELGCLWDAEVTRLGGVLYLDVSALAIIAGESICLFSSSETEGEFNSIDLIGVSCLEASLQADGSEWSLLFEDSTCSAGIAHQIFRMPS